MTCFLFCRALSLRDVLDDYDFALKHKPDDLDIKTVKETLQLSTFALREHPAQLSSQLVGRIESVQSEFVQRLLEQAHYCTQVRDRNSSSPFSFFFLSNLVNTVIIGQEKKWALLTG